MVSQATQPISKAGVAFFSSLCVTTFGLGCWQSQRYFEKIELVQKRNDELTLQPSSLEKDAMCSLQERIDSLSQNGKNGKVLQAAHDGNDDDIVRGFRPLKVKGKFMHEYEILVGPRGPPPGAISSSGPNSGRSSGGMSSSPQGYFIITSSSVFTHSALYLNRLFIRRRKTRDTSHNLALLEMLYIYNLMLNTNLKMKTI